MRSGEREGDLRLRGMENVNKRAKIVSPTDTSLQRFEQPLDISSRHRRVEPRNYLCMCAREHMQASGHTHQLAGAVLRRCRGARNQHGSMCRLVSVLARETRPDKAHQERACHSRDVIVPVQKHRVRAPGHVQLPPHLVRLLRLDQPADLGKNLPCCQRVPARIVQAFGAVAPEGRR